MMKANWFLALPVPTDTWFDTLIYDLPETCRAFHPTDLHLTLAFLGPMLPQKQGQIEALMANITAQTITASFDHFLPLPSEKRLSAMTLSLAQGRQQVADLMRQHRTPLLEAAGARPDHRDPLPHATFARPIRKYGAQGRQAALHWMAEKQVPETSFKLEKIALYTWSEQRPTLQFKIVAEKDLDS
jgi:2'-5' RNA ligase